MLPVGDDRYALAAEHVREVAAAPRTTDLPGMPAWALGLVNLRGEVVPLLDTAALLGLGPLPSAAFAVVVHTSPRRLTRPRAHAGIPGRSVVRGAAATSRTCSAASA